jgi:hypothetical protein
MIAEYGSAQRAANDLIYGLANEQGMGTFAWQPTDLWTRAGATYSAQPNLSLYDRMKMDYAGRL